MPSGGQTTDELLILQWEKKVGDFIKRGDILFEIETDKANLTVESFAEGILLEITHGEGAQVKVGEVVAYIGDVEDKLPALSQSTLPEEGTRKEGGQVYPDTKDTSTIREADKIYASPLAKSRARQESIPLEDVASFVSKKMIRKDDVARYLTHLGHSNRADSGDSYFVELTLMRKAIAKRMKENISAAPHYVVSVDIDMTDVVLLRGKLNASLAGTQLKISYNDIIMKVAANAIGRHPLINSTYLENKIQVHRNVNFGLAISVEGGLLAPVIKNINRKCLSQIAGARAEVTEKARNGKITASDIAGGTITLSNLGMYGINDFTAIINQPESCILAVGAIIEKPIAIRRKVEIRDMMTITASFDHRLIDGAAGAAFLQEMKTMLENPEMLVL